VGARLAKWWRLPGEERLQFLMMLAGLPLVSMLLRVAGYVRCRRWIESLTSRAEHAAGDAELRKAERLAQLAAIAGRRGLHSASCLRQSLLVYGWLRLRRLGPRLQLGARKGPDGFDAHAWVELEGTPLAQSEMLHTPFPDEGKAIIAR
jgi:hypothetical protein